jgi:8-oxo-dGTP pyrophosphatase MutT (NUDIX family)
MARKANSQVSCSAAQIAALPVRRAQDGSYEVLLITSRETRRWIIPKGWPMKGLKDHKAAAKEAEEEAGVIGSVRKDPIGSYSYWKRRTAHFELCQVAVYLLEVQDQLKNWREKHQREARWFSAREAAERVEEPGLGDIIASLEQRPAPSAVEAARPF